MKCKNDGFCERDGDGKARGWAISHDSRIDYELIIVRCDACDMFAGDEEATLHVAKLADNAGARA